MIRLRIQINEMVCLVFFRWLWGKRVLKFFFSRTRLFFDFVYKSCCVHWKLQQYWILYRDGKIEVNVFVVVSIFGVTVSMHLFKYITCVCNCSIVISNIQFKEILFMNLLWFSLFILYHTQLPLLRKHDFFFICLLSLSISHFHEYLWNVTICFHFFALINW